MYLKQSNTFIDKMKQIYRETLFLQNIIILHTRNITLLQNYYSTLQQPDASINGHSFTKYICIAALTVFALLREQYREE